MIVADGILMISTSFVLVVDDLLASDSFELNIMYIRGMVINDRRKALLLTNDDELCLLSLVGEFVKQVLCRCR